jgi:di/tricarboxylate transporter
MFMDPAFALMTLPAWQTLAVIAVLFLMLVFTSVPADMVFVGGLGVLLLLDVLDPETALAGFGSQGLVTVGALYVVVTGLQETGGLNVISRHLLGKADKVKLARAKALVPVSALSAFLNNTPVVALMIPVMTEWCRRHKLSASRFLIPLSYASILGGICTLVGTSTNLVVNGLYVSRYGGPGLSMFDITLLGLPCAALGLVYILLFSDRLLPKRDGARDVFTDPKEFTLEFVVQGKCALLDSPIRDTELVDVPGGYLVELVREDEVIAPVPIDEPVQEGDRLLYAGNLETIKSLLQVKGLHLASDYEFESAPMPQDRRLVEAVVSHTCPLVGKTLREGMFRQQYNAVVIAMARNGERLRGSLRDIALKAGDVLLVESHAGFVPRQQESGDFYLLHTLQGQMAKPNVAKASISFGILVLMVLVAGMGWLSMLKAALFAAGLMLATGCCKAATARRRIEWNVLMVIGAALGLGAALEESGAAAAVASILLGFTGSSPMLALAVIYLGTIVFTELITNNAAVALMFPIAMRAAEDLEVNPLPFLFCLMIAGSASFLTPIGYQTNLMVYGAGGYKFTDYVRFGLPLSLIVGTTAVLLAPVIWSF